MARYNNANKMDSKAKAGLSLWKVAGREIGRKSGVIMIWGCQSVHCFLLSPFLWRGAFLKLNHEKESVNGVMGVCEERK